MQPALCTRPACLLSLARRVGSRDWVRGSRRGRERNVSRDGGSVERSGQRRAAHHAPPRRITRLHLATTGGVLTLRRRGTGWGPLHGNLLGQPVTAVATVLGQPDIVYAASGATIYTSPDAGSRWRPLRSLGGEVEVCALLAEPRPRARLLAGLRPAAIAISEDGGVNWTAASLPAVATGAVTQIVPAPGEAGRLYALAGEALLVSYDNGYTWEPLSELQAPASTLTVHPEAPATLYVGGPAGLFRTRNGGRNWQRLTPQPVTAVLIHPNRPRTLLAALPAGLALSPNTGVNWHPIAGGEAEPGARCISLVGHAPAEVILAIGADGRILQVVDGRCTPLAIGPTPPVLAVALASSELVKWPGAPKRASARRRRPTPREGAGAEPRPAPASPAAPQTRSIAQ